MSKVILTLYEDEEQGGTKKVRFIENYEYDFVRLGGFADSVLLNDTEKRLYGP